MYVETIKQDQVLKTDPLWYGAFDPFLDRSLRYIVFHGGRGSLKSTHAALGLLKVASEERIRALCCREIQLSIKDSVHRLLVDLIDKHKFAGYHCTDTAIRNRKSGSEFGFKGLLRNESSIKSFEGIDIAWVEESEAVSQTSLDYLVPTVRKKGSQIWFTFNRFSDNDPVWTTICKNPMPRTYVRKINMMDVPVRFRSQELIELMAKHKAEDYDKYLWIWEGEPIGQDATACIPKSKIIKAMNREVEDIGGEAASADIARFGDDRIMFGKRKGLKQTKEAVYRKKSIVETANLLMDFVDYDKKIPINIDDTGLGGGVTDILKAKGYNAIPINFGWGKDYLKEPDKYYNVVTEMWFNFRDIIGQVQLIKNDETKEELGNRLYVYKPDERKMIEPKDAYKKRHLISPDGADMIIMLFYQPKDRGGFIGFSQTEM